MLLDVKAIPKMNSTKSAEKPTQVLNTILLGCY